MNVLTLDVFLFPLLIRNQRAVKRPITWSHDHMYPAYSFCGRPMLCKQLALCASAQSSRSGSPAGLARAAECRELPGSVWKSPLTLTSQRLGGSHGMMEGKWSHAKGLQRREVCLVCQGWLTGSFFRKLTLNGVTTAYDINACRIHHFYSVTPKYELIFCGLVFVIHQSRLFNLKC